MPDPAPEFLDPFDECPWLPARELFRRLGYEPLPPAAVDDFQLRGRLWEFIHALAGRRFYLRDSNHLSDRELYVWLHDRWFGEEVADIPFAAGWNCHVCVLDPEIADARETQIWLRYFATEKERAAWAALNPHSPLPPHQPAPHDRDRWLPEPPGFRPDDEAGDSDFPGPEDLEDEDEDAPDEDDPLGLQQADADIRAQKRREESAAVTGGEESGDWQRPVDKLQSAQIPLLPPAELTDETLTAQLWQLLHNLYCTGFYVLHSDHLSDAELYAELWRRGLRDEALLPGKCRNGGWFHDFVGSGSDEHQAIFLRYHATDEQRERHLRDWPDDPLPPKTPRPFNRDWRLPKGPF